MKTVLFILLLSISLFITGCNKENTTAKTVKYYQEHPQERKIVLERCSKEPGLSDSDLDCINAKKAELTTMEGDPNRYRL